MRNRGLLTLGLGLALAGSALAAQPDASGPQLTAGQTFLAINSDGVAARPGAGDGGGPATIYDSQTAATVTFTGTLPRTFMGGPFTVVAGTGTVVTVQEATFFLGHVSPTPSTFSNGLRVQVQFWDTYSSGTAAAVFSAPVGAVQEFFVPGPITLGSNTSNAIAVTLPTPLVFSGLENGMAISFAGDNGAGFATSDLLTSVIRVTTPLAVGTFTPNAPNYNSPGFGFYRNVGGQTNFNFLSTDLRLFAAPNNTNIGIALQLRGQVTPVELQGFEIQ